ncbi:MAG: PIN domain-containing protein [Verrucomicrobiota bacterium]
MKAGVLDTNVLLRFFLQDDPKQSPAATAFFKKAEDENIDLFLQDATVAEVTFVMDRVFRRSRIQIANALLDFIQNPFVTVQNPVVLTDALLRYRNHSIDFPEALVGALAVSMKVPAVSFDKDWRNWPASYDLSRRQIIIYIDEPLVPPAPSVAKCPMAPMLPLRLRRLLATHAG